MTIVAPRVPPTTSVPPPAPRNPTAPAKPEAAPATQVAVTDELALAIRFAAATQNAALSLGSTFGPVLGVVVEQAFQQDTRRVQQLALHVATNEIDARVDGTATSAALVVWDDERTPEGSLVVTANRFANASIAQATALIVSPRRIAITGNLVANDTTQMQTDAQLRVLLAQLAPRSRAVPSDAAPTRLAELVVQRWCLVVLPSLTTDTPRVAITGNVLEGLVELPVRPQQLPPWTFLNTQV